MGTTSNILSPYINGRFLQLDKPERVFHSNNPMKPSDVLAVTGWNKDLVGEIVESAKRAQSQFAAQSLSSRMQFVNAVISNLRQAADEIKSQMMLELARSRWAVEQEWQLCEEVFRHLPRFCSDELSPQRSELGWNWTYAPVGLILISTNVALPVYTAVYSILTSLAAGNAVCFRPSVHCPLSASLIASCLHQANPPAGIVQVVYGDLEVYRRLVLSHQFDTIFYTGGEESLEQLRRDMSTDQNVRLVLCGGGKNAAVIASDANLDECVQKILLGACLDAGQRLESTSLAFVDNRVVDAFVDKFVKAVKQMPIGVKADLNDPSMHIMGPLCSQTSWERFLRFQGIAARESSETLRWGKAIDNQGGGYFVSPGVHLMDNSKVRNSVYASNAFFAPDVAIIPVEGIEAAVNTINDLSSARSVSVFSGNEAATLNVRRNCVAPLVLNAQPTVDLHPLMPTMGRGKAGNSCVMGLRFLHHTVYPQTLNMTSMPAGAGQTSSSGTSAPNGKSSSGKTVKIVSALLALLTGISGALIPQPAKADYRKSVEGNEVVKGKFYPKKGRFQMNGSGGFVLNQSFVNTFLFGGSLTYHFDEWHGIHFEGLMGKSFDKQDRTCVENFYLDPEYAGYHGESLPCYQGPAASAPKNAKDKEPNTRPWNEDKFKDNPKTYENRRPFQKNAAYMPIREIGALLSANYQWTPVYGKSLFFLSQVVYLDFYLNAGLGVTLSNFYQLQETFTDANGKTVNMKDVGVVEDEQYGMAGRPTPIAQTSPTANFAIGSRFFMARKILLDVQLKNYSIIGSDGRGGTDFSTPFALTGGLGLLL